MYIYICVSACVCVCVCVCVHVRVVDIFKEFDSIHIRKMLKIWYSQRNCYRYNHVLQKHERSSSLPSWC